jgi:hypothetical protein
MPSTILMKRILASESILSSQVAVVRIYLIEWQDETAYSAGI